jgi:ABC-type nickel/cobalt efflux system permease component RcnA
MVAVLRRFLVLMAVLVAAVAGVVALAAPALAHPLGNFTVNRYARIEVSADAVRVLYVLDLAEIPAFQDRREVEADAQAYARTRAEEISAGLELVVDDELRALTLVDQALEEPPGQGGLTTLRLTALYESPLDEGAPNRVRRASFADTNDPDRIGWREIVVVARPDAEVVASDAPAEDITDELRTYPEDRLESPLDLRQISFSFTPGSVAAEPPALDGSSGAVADVDGFAALITRSDLTPLAVASLLALALGFGFGAVHAVGPGHGKTIMAAYLVSSRGRPRDAVLLGGVVSIMHTASVLVLGLVLVQVDRSIAAESVFPILTLVSGVAVTGVGIWLLVARWRKLRSSGAGRGGHSHTDSDNGHSHDGHDGHDGHGHSHALPAGVAPLSRRGLVALGASGGLFPSPSAVLVIVAAVGLGRAGLGLALLAAFSIGLAATLSAVGLGLVYGRNIIERRGGGQRLAFLPVLGAVALIALGSVIIIRGIIEL